ncbi:uncharacterized protein [Branchiostoma lanceolatum]|uniref:uncharacterized protein n=1 Tax=Branchiostoma lanceolatum TaxID=7740 RepID=UPI0034569C78
METRQTEDVGMQWDSSEELSARSDSYPVTCATELEGEETNTKITEQISDVGDDRAPETSVQIGKSSTERSSEEKTHGIPQSDKKKKKKGEVKKLDETTIPKFPDDCKQLKTVKFSPTSPMAGLTRSDSCSDIDLTTITMLSSDGGGDSTEDDGDLDDLVVHDV